MNKCLVFIAMGLLENIGRWFFNKITGEENVFKVSKVSEGIPDKIF